MNASKLAAFAWALLVLFGLAFALEVGSMLHSRQQEEQRARNQGTIKARAAAQHLDQALASFEAVVHGIRAELESGRLKPREVSGRLGAVLGKAPEATVKMGVLFQPYGADPKLRLFGPSVSREGGKVRPYSSEKEMDYTAQDWFGGELAQGGWSERHFSREDNLLLVDYSEPFRLPGASRVSGAVRMEVNLDGIRHIVGNAVMGASGYGFLLSAKGVYLVDPRTEFVRRGRTFLEVADEMEDPGRRFVGEKALQGEPAFAESKSALDGKKVWILLEPVTRAHWSLGTVIEESEVVALPQSVKVMAVRLVSLGLGFALALLYLATNGQSPTVPRLWHFSVGASMLLAAGVVMLWYFAYTLPSGGNGHDVAVLDQTALHAFLEKHGRLEAGLSDVAADLIPCGVFVQTLELNGPAQVRVTGMVWQRFPKGAPTEARGGVIFPEAVSGDVDKPLEREDGKDVIQYSSFKVVLKQRLVSSPNYPFDHAQVRIWIRPKAISGNEILVPDLGAYERLEPTALPGLDRESGVLGWNVEKSFFSYMFQSYNANFGMQNFVGQQDSPELIFNVALKRQFLNPFIATFLPILAVVGLLFAGVMTISGNPERIKATGYQCLTFQRHAATLLFPLLVAQVNLRSKIEADRLVYLEHYYFVVYGLILLVVTSALAFALSDRRVLNRMDNALVKLGFWPLLFVSFYAISTQFLL